MFIYQGGNIKSMLPSENGGPMLCTSLSMSIIVVRCKISSKARQGIWNQISDMYRER